MSTHTFARGIRKIILERAMQAREGHIGSALSVVDLVGVLYEHCLHIPSPEDPERDRFVLSKGHAALALYGALYLKGWITESELNGYGTDGSMLGTHPEHALRGVDFSTGSLGQGLSFGVGAALAARRQHSARRVFVLMSDAECNEGAVWEAAMFAAHHRLDNLTVLLDDNGLQALGHTRDIIDLSPLGERWQAFGWQVVVLDGHDPDAIRGVVQEGGPEGKPRVLIAKTTLGKSIPFMENELRWHYKSMSPEEYAQACQAIQALEAL